MPQLDDGYRRGNRRMWYRRTVRGRCVPRNASNVLAAKSRRANVLSLSRHVPSLSGSATRRVAQNEARKRRADERHVVGCCEELGRIYPSCDSTAWTRTPLPNTLIRLALTVAAAENSCGILARAIATFSASAVFTRIVSGPDKAPEKSGARRASAGV